MEIGLKLISNPAATGRDIGSIYRFKYPPVPTKDVGFGNIGFQLWNCTDKDKNQFTFWCFVA